jgi:hypothetical protein
MGPRGPPLGCTRVQRRAARAQSSRSVERRRSSARKDPKKPPYGCVAATAPYRPPAHPTHTARDTHPRACYELRATAGLRATTTHHTPTSSHHVEPVETILRRPLRPHARPRARGPRLGLRHRRLGSLPRRVCAARAGARLVQLEPHRRICLEWTVSPRSRLRCLRSTGHLLSRRQPRAAHPTSVRRLRTDRLDEALSLTWHGTSPNPPERARCSLGTIGACDPPGGSVAPVLPRTARGHAAAVAHADAK